MSFVGGQESGLYTLLPHMAGVNSSPGLPGFSQPALDTRQGTWSFRAPTPRPHRSLLDFCRGLYPGAGWDLLLTVLTDWGRCVGVKVLGKVLRFPLQKEVPHLILATHPKRTSRIMEQEETFARLADKDMALAQGLRCYVRSRCPIMTLLLRPWEAVGDGQARSKVGPRVLNSFSKASGTNPLRGLYLGSTV